MPSATAGRTWPALACTSTSRASSETCGARARRGRGVAEVGFVGLGVMGGGVARRLLDAGHTVVVWNRTRDQADWLLEAGARWADSPREVAEASEVVFSMVTNTAAVRAVCNGPEGILAGLAPGK